LQAEIRRQQEHDLLTIRMHGAVRPKHRTRQPWQPTDRENAILNIPKKLSLEECCCALDTAGVPFPEKRQQHQGRPTSHGVLGRAEAILATIEVFFGINPLTQRDAKTNRLDALLSLNTPRPDTPTTLPVPAAAPAAVMKMSVPDLSTTVASRPDETVNQGTLPVILQSALRQDLEMSPEQRTAILERVRSIKTREQARQYLAEVQKKIRERRAAT